HTWYALALHVARLLPLPAAVHRTTIVETGSAKLPMGLATVTTVGLRSWDHAGGVTRVSLRNTDALVYARLTAGQPVAGRTRSLGPTKHAVVEHLELDSEAPIPALVAALPSAEWPRKWLIASLAREARWSELVTQLREYRRYYPDDDEVVRHVAVSLRGGRQAALARAVEREFLR